MTEPTGIATLRYSKIVDFRIFQEKKREFILIHPVIVSLSKKG